MNRQFKDCDLAETVEKLKQKYLERRKQLAPPEDIDVTSGTSDEAVQRFILANRSKRPSKELKCYSKALRELVKAVTNHPDQFGGDHGLHSSNEDLSGDSAAAPLQDSPLHLTETDVTLPSCLDGSPGSQETETDGELHRARQLPDSCRSSSLVLAKVYQEMMTIYEQLKAERESQQQWEKELQERERRLKQQEEAVGRLAGLEEMLHIRIPAEEEKHQQEVSQLQDLLRERSKENRRLRSSFDTIKELNDGMKKQRSSSPTRLKLLALLLDWVLDGQKFSSVAGNEGKGVGQCLPLEFVLNERCLKVLPLLADQLHHTPLSEPDLLLNLLRLIHWAFRHMDSSTQHVALSATLRRIGEEVSKPPAQVTGLQSEDPDLPKSDSGAAGGPCRSCPLSRSPCLHTRILSTIIILRTVTQADVLAQALDSLRTELMSEESRGLFIRYGGVCELLSMLQAGRGGLHTPVDILMQLSEQSCYLSPFLEACGWEFFQTASQLLKNPRLEFPTLEKLSILLQKLSNIRKNRRLFERSSLHLQIQELLHNANQTHTFLCLNLRSILHNLK
ncbi:coiled-coil domain-containing protein 138-like isoform X5 [Cyclopterus lumpus]|uniref:coiled-coil domain-containing protein 138-like isoform X5 n=1 Tax=Cyclopterus lumpus TaxID=8103 RepID=UPI001485F379|nr:coiled-coil domain-containing protein 138-like isoform X5 [Cyclopterus lumpus]